MRARMSTIQSTETWYIERVNTRFTTALTNKTKMHSHTLSSLWESLVRVCSFIHPYMYIVQRTCFHLKANILCMYIVWCDDDGDDDDQRYMAVFAFFYYFLVPYSVFACVCVGLNFSVSSSLLLLLLLSHFCTHSICDDARMKHDSTVGFSLSLLFVYFFLRRLLLLLLSYLSSFLSVFFGFAKLGWLVFFIFISLRRWV